MTHGLFRMLLANPALVTAQLAIRLAHRSHPVGIVDAAQIHDLVGGDLRAATKRLIWDGLRLSALVGALVAPAGMRGLGPPSNTDRRVVLHSGAPAGSSVVFGERPGSLAAKSSRRLYRPAVNYRR
jgi:hypothetical protein